ncbi:hypothetical protein HOD29_06450 [archaeon]|jgi:choline kinase|nr:hypothetical protein [archaeon]
MTEIALVYMVAGLSSRFKGKPKAFAKVGPNNESLIEYSLNQTLPVGFTKIVFIVGKKTKPLFQEKFQDSYKNIPVHYALQSFDENKRDKPWGTTDAICSAKEFLDCPFIVCNGDDIYGKEAFEILTTHLKEKNINTTLGYKLEGVIPEKGEVNRGIFQIENNKVIDLKETFNISKKNLNSLDLTTKSLCSMNIFALTPETLNLLNEKLKLFKEENKESRTKECLLPKEINDLLNENKILLDIYPTQAQWFGITHPEDELIVRNKIKESE